MKFLPDNKAEEAIKSGLQVADHGKQKPKKSICFSCLHTLPTDSSLFALVNALFHLELLPFSLFGNFGLLILIISYPTAHSVQPVSLPVSFHTPVPAFRAFPLFVTSWSSAVCSENCRQLMSPLFRTCIQCGAEMTTLYHCFKAQIL